jgi:hypothetical protein
VKVPGPHYAELRRLLTWRVIDTEDAAETMRHTAVVLAATGDAQGAAKVLERVSALLSTGTADGSAQTSGTDAVQAWDEAFGRHDDPEVRARLKAADIALRKRDRDRADAAARADLEAKEKQIAGRKKLIKRGRRL